MDNAHRGNPSSPQEEPLSLQDAQKSARDALHDIGTGAVSGVDAILRATQALATENVSGQTADETACKRMSAQDRTALQVSASKAMNALGRDDYEQLCKRVMFVPEHADGLVWKDFEEMLAHCTRIGASDINLQTDEPVIVTLAGRHMPVTHRKLRGQEMSIFLTGIYGANAESLLNTGVDLDRAYSFLSGRDRFRFRVNITACATQGRAGSQTTLRTIRADPMRLNEMRVEQGILDSYDHRDGMVVICGPTGSGKSSLLAGIITAILENQDKHVKVLTYEKPIEYTYDLVKKGHNIVAQTELGDHLRGQDGMGDFEYSVRNSLRRAPNIILVGESRDRATMSAALEAAETGHLLFTTLHANNSVGQAIYRMLNLFPAQERESKVYEVLEAMRLVVIQRLERSTDGGRVPLREFLRFERDMIDTLTRLGDANAVATRVNEYVRERGQSMAASAQMRYLEGLLPYATYLTYCRAQGQKPMPPQFGEKQTW